MTSGDLDSRMSLMEHLVELRMRIIRSAIAVAVGAVVVNRVLPELFSRDDEELFEQLRSPEPLAALTERVGEGVTEVLDGAELAVSLRRGRVPHLSRLRDGLPSGLPVLYLPYLFTRSHGVRATARIAESLGEELGF